MARLMPNIPGVEPLNHQLVTWILRGKMERGV